MIAIFSEAEIEREELAEEFRRRQESRERISRICDALREEDDDPAFGADGRNPGRRVFRAIPGRLKRFGNRFSCTGGGIKSGAKRDRSDARRARRLAAGKLLAQEAAREMALVDRQNLPEYKGQRLAPAAPVVAGDGQSIVRLENGSCQVTLVYREGNLCAAHVRPAAARHSRVR